MSKTVTINQDKLLMLKEALDEFMVDKNSNFISRNSIWFILYRGDLLLFDEKNKQLLDDFIYRHQNDLSEFVGEYELKKYKASNNFDNFINWLGSFIPYLLTGWIYGQKKVYIQDNEYYDILNSNELYQLVKTLPHCNFYVGYKEIDKNEILGNKGQNMPKFWYHGTTAEYAYEIIYKGLRPAPDKSLYNIKHDKTIFFTSSFEQAKSYGNYKWHHHRKFLSWPSTPCVLKIDASKIDNSKLVLDYDVYNIHNTDYNDEYYNNRMSELGINYDNMFHTNTVKKYTDPRKFSKVGYRGIIMPDAIVSVIIIDELNGNKEMSRYEFNEYINEVSSLKDINLDDLGIKEETINEVAPEVDEYEIGDEGSNPPIGGNYYHVNESYNVSIRGDLDSINTIEFIPHENAREEGYKDDEIEDFEPYYEVEAMDMNGETILYADLTVEELFDYFPQSIINDIIERDKSNATRLSNPSINQYRIDDILYRDTTPSDINDVEEVNRIAKKIQTGGPSAYLLTDGDIIYFHDHIYINNIDGITPDKFIALGNIRLSNGGFELIKVPTRQQMYGLKQWIRQQEGGIYVDFCEESHQTYPRTLFSTKYGSPNAERIVNDIYYYFEEGIKPQDNFYESKENDSEVIIENTFEKWFGSSILKDENGQPLKMYHGTDAEFDSFSKEHIGRNSAYEGYGFNFTPFESRARGYNSKRVIEAYLRVTNPMTTKSYNISLRQLVEVIRQLDEGKPYTDTIVAAYESPRYGENWDKKYYMRALPAAARTIYQYNKENEYGDAGLYAEICLNGNADKFKTIETFEKLGYDSAIFYDNDDRINTVIVFEPNQIKLTSNKTFSTTSDVMGENFDFEVSSSDIDLSSFKKKHELVPNIWNPDGKLNSRIRLKLLDIADDFWEYVNLTWVKPSGIILTGSICNFNWSQYSDIDLHLIVDFDEIDEKTEFVKDYLDSKKNEWNKEHSGLQIMGYPVELYVQNLGEMPESNGIYDLEENDWVREPNPDDIKSIGLNKFSIKDKAAEIMTIIDDMYNTLASTDDSHKIEQMGDDANYLWKKVKEMRKSSLEKNGEMGNGNVVYKYLRRKGYLDKLWKLSNLVYDKTNSITESKSEKKKYTVYINDKKDETFSDMNWKRKPKVGKGFYCGGAVFKIKKVTDDSIYAIEESKNTSAQLLNEWDKIDYFEKAKQYFGTTNDLNECGFILPNGEMLDLSSVKGRRGIPHRNIEAIGVGLEIFIEHGAIRCDSRYKLINICKKPTKEQINRLVQIIKANDGSVSLDLGNGHITFDYVDYKNVNYKRIINDIINFFDNKIKPSSLYESKNIIKEYLEKDNNLPLYKYFKWASTASSCEKARDLAYFCSYYIKKYIERVYYRYSEFEDLLNDGEFDYEDDSLVERFCNMLEENNLCDHFISEMQGIVDYYELPSWCTMDFNRVVKNEWCIHFGSDSESIAKEGFTGGTPEIEHLAYTNAEAQKSSVGYDFAFLINDRSVDYNGYGDEAVIFRTSGVEIYHYGDNQNQVVFWGPNVKSFIPIHQDNGDWVVYGQNGQVLVRCGRPSEIALWATENLPQYRKQIMTGKNGYIPKMGRWNAETNKYERVPYPIYRNESIKKYITLLKENLINEEVVADGSSNGNPYKERWKSEREALKNFISNYGTIMQSKEDNKMGRLYKVFYDKGISELIGYNYCLCVQWDEINLKPKSVVYIRALDKFTPNIRRNIQYDTRGFDNVRGSYDDLRYRNY